MKKKSRKLRRRRNAAAAPTGPKPRRRLRLRLRRRSRPPDWRTTLAAIAGGAGGAALGGLVVHQQILSPEAVGLGMMGIGSATAYFADGNTRVLGNSVAAAGAGQLALSLMAKRAISVNTAPAVIAAPQLPPAAPSPSTGSGAPTQVAPGPPRRSSSDGGVVVDLFRDAALELDELEDDDWRFGIRDAGAGRVDVYDLDLDDAA